MYISASNLNEGPLSFDQLNAYLGMKTTTKIKQNKKKTYTKIMHREKGK